MRVGAKKERIEYVGNMESIVTNNTLTNDMIQNYQGGLNNSNLSFHWDPSALQRLNLNDMVLGIRAIRLIGC